MATFCVSRPWTWTPRDKSTVHTRRLARVQKPQKTSAAHDAKKNKAYQNSSAVRDIIFGRHRPTSAALRDKFHSQNCETVRRVQADRKSAASEVNYSSAKFIMPRFANTPSRLIDRGNSSRDQQMEDYKAERNKQINLQKAKSEIKKRANSASRSRLTQMRNSTSLNQFEMKSAKQAWHSPSIAGPHQTNTSRSRHKSHLKKQQRDPQTLKLEEQVKIKLELTNLPFWFVDQADTWELLHAPTNTPANISNRQI